MTVIIKMLYIRRFLINILLLCCPICQRQATNISDSFSTNKTCNIHFKNTW